MPLVLANRVQESGTANTTVSFTLTGAVTGFQSFSTIGNGNTTYYSATDAAGNWEVGLGLYLATGSILVRTAVYESSNAGSAVTFSGAVNVFVTLPSGSAIYEDASGNASPLGTVTSGTWQGSTVGVAYGGTGVTASSGPNSVVLRDANENITINRLNQGLQTTTASGGTTVLTAASDFNQALVGTGGHTYSLPDATMLSDTTAFQFNNNATGTLTITDYASATVGTIAPGGAAGVALLNNSTVGGTWDVHAYIPENVTWGTNALALGTTVITGGTWNGGTIQSGYGGTGLTTFTGANNALYSTSASALAAGTLPVAAGGTGLTSYTLNGVVYASGTGTLATSGNLTYNGTNLINSGAYTAPSNGAGAGTKTTITGSTGTGQAGTSGGNGFIEIIGGGGTSLWTTFTPAIFARRRGGIYLQAGTAQADAGGTYVSGSNIDILGSAGTNNGTSTGFGSRILIQSGSVTKTDGQTNTAASINLASSSSTVGSSVSISSGNFNTSANSNNGSSVTVAAGAATTGGSIILFPGNATVSGSTVGKAYVRDPATNTDNEILTTKSSATPTVAGIVFGKTQVCASGGRTALGSNAGLTSQCVYTTAIGISAGRVNQGSGAVAIGNSAGCTNQGFQSVAIGNGAAMSNQPYLSVAIGPATDANGSCQTHIGPIRYACSTGGLDSLFYCGTSRELIRGAAGGGGGGSPATPSVAGVVFGETTSCSGLKTALGYGAALCATSNSVAIGANSAVFANNGVAVGTSAYSNADAVVVGVSAYSYSSNTVVIGKSASVSFCCASADNSIAIGSSASVSTACAVVIGKGATANNNAPFNPVGSVVIGACASSAGACSVVIGRSSFASPCSGTFIGPIRNSSGPFTLKYCPGTREITYV